MKREEIIEKIKSGRYDNNHFLFSPKLHPCQFCHYESKVIYGKLLKEGKFRIQELNYVDIIPMAQTLMTISVEGKHLFLEETCQKCKERFLIAPPSLSIEYLEYILKEREKELSYIG